MPQHRCGPDVTYLTPDDWGLNHNIAPGDARGPQPTPQPQPKFYNGDASRGLAPAPPFRGYFGRPPARPAYDHRTHSPFAVPDGLWTQGIVPLSKLHGEGTLGPVLPNYTGIQGLGGFVPRRSTYGVAGLGEEDPNQILERMASQMKRDAIESAAAQTVLLISLNYVPVIGTAISIVLGVVMAIGISHYKKKAQLVLARFETDVKSLANSYEQRLHVIKMAVFDQEKTAALQLALSGATLAGWENAEAGFGHLGHLGSSGGDKWRKHWKRVVSPVYHVQTLVKAIQKPVQGALRQIQKITPDSIDRILQRPIDRMSSVQAELNRAQSRIEGNLATLSGESQWRLAQERAGQAYAAASKDMEAQYQAAVLNVQSAEYRQALQVVIAKRVRGDPNLAALISTIGGSQAQSLVARLTGGIPNQYAASGQPGAGIPIPQQSSSGEKAALTAIPLIGAVVAFLALGRG